MKYLLAISFIFLLGCKEQEYYSGYVVDKQYGRCNGSITIINDKPYCNDTPLKCRVTVGEWVNDKFLLHKNIYNSDICPMIQYNDYIP